jgi:hypothetical protein
VPSDYTRRIRSGFINAVYRLIRFCFKKLKNGTRSVPATLTQIRDSEILNYCVHRR